MIWDRIVGYTCDKLSLFWISVNSLALVGFARNFFKFWINNSLFDVSLMQLRTAFETCGPVKYSLTQVFSELICKSLYRGT